MKKKVTLVAIAHGSPNKHSQALFMRDAMRGSCKFRDLTALNAKRLDHVLHKLRMENRSVCHTTLTSVSLTVFVHIYD